MTDHDLRQELADARTRERGLVAVVARLDARVAALESRLCDSARGAPVYAEPLRLDQSSAMQMTDGSIEVRPDERPTERLPRVRPGAETEEPQP